MKTLFTTSLIPCMSVCLREEVQSTKHSSKTTRSYLMMIDWGYSVRELRKDSSVSQGVSTSQLMILKGQVRECTSTKTSNLIKNMMYMKERCIQYQVSYKILEDFIMHFSS
jgi:hypothetical protein